jgi:ABC-type sugar transport system ATPase subunit
MTDPLLELAGIGKNYGRVTVLDGVSLQVRSGEVHAIVGENGAGKSTLLKILAGVVPPNRGEIRLRGKSVDIGRLDPERAHRLGVSVVHQEFSLLPAMTIAENVFLGREPRRKGFLDRASMRSRTVELLARLGSDLDPDLPAERLGVAGAQIVEIAKALSLDADVLAMDEPSAVLSGPELEQLFHVIEHLSADGVAVLYVSHRLDEIFRICDRYTVLKDGVVSGSGRIEETNHDGLVKMMVGREVSQVFPPPGVEPGSPRLSLRSFQVPGLPAPVDLDVRSGEIVGFAGLNGAGRSRLVRGIFGVLPSEGTVIVDGHERRAFAHPADAMAAGIAFIPEDRKQDGLALGKSVRQNVSLNVLERLTSGSLLSTPAETAFATEQIDRYDVRTRRDGATPTGALSGGNQQKVVLAKWLANEPSVIILDEPTRGIDVGSKAQIYELLRALADQGAAVLVVSSELVEVLSLADRILVMADGRIVDEMHGDDATEERVLTVITESSAHEVRVDEEASAAPAGLPREVRS